MFIFEIVLLPFLARQVIEHDARPHILAAAYASFFLIIGLALGNAFLPSLVGRLVNFGLVYLYLRLLSRLRGVAFWLVVPFGVAIPFLTNEIAGTLVSLFS